MAIPLTDRELKKGSAELLILSLLDRARHGYEIGQLIELRSRGALRFNVASFYPLLYRLETRGGSVVAGWRSPGNAGADIIDSRTRAERSWPPSAPAGANLWKRLGESPELSMPELTDFRGMNRRRFLGLSHAPRVRFDECLFSSSLARSAGRSDHCDAERMILLARLR